MDSVQRKYGQNDDSIFETFFFEGGHFIKKIMKKYTTSSEF